MSEWDWSLPRMPEGPVGNKFIIVKHEGLLPCERAAFGTNDTSCFRIGKRGKEPTLIDVFDLMFFLEGTYGINRTRLVTQFAQIPAFAHYLRYDAPQSLCNYISNPAYPGPEQYSQDAVLALGRAVNRTLDQDDEEWIFG